MNVLSKAPESTDRHDDLNDLSTDSSSHVIEFFTARDRMIADPDDSTQLYGYRRETKNCASRRELLHPLSDPLEDWLNSLITGAALVSLLIGILCWPSFTTTKSEGAKLLPLSQTESFLVTQNPE
jgi:hypothetical protein